MNYKIKTKLEQGYNPIVVNESLGLKLIRFGILRLEQSEKFSRSPFEGRESVVINLSGSCNISLDNKDYHKFDDRSNVFENKATALYLPPGCRWKVVATSSLEMAIVTAPAEKNGKPQLITPDDIEVVTSGRDTWERDFHKIIMENVNAQSLFISETFNKPGKWSSYPPHKHDVYNPPKEVPLEELYFYKVRPKQGFGFQRIYTKDRSIDEVYVVENNDTIVFPKGYHPTCSAPGYELYYLWVISGKERILAASEDSDHTWIKEK